MNAPRGWHRIKSRYRYRVVAGVLAVALPLTILLGLVLTRSASSSLTAAQHRGAESVARAVTLRFEDWISERRENMAVIANEASGHLTDPGTTALLVHIDKTYGDYEVIETTNAAGQIVGVSRRGAGFAIRNRAWFRDVVGGKPVLTTMTEEDGDLRWIVAAPIRARDGHIEGVVAGDLDETLLAEILNPEIDAKGSEVAAVDQKHHVLYDTSMGDVANPAAMIALGSLRTKLDNAAVNQALSGQAGSASFADLRGRSAIGGFDSLDDLHWAILVSKPRSVVVAPVTHQRYIAFWVINLGALLAIGFVLWFARREACSLRALADESTHASTEVNASAAQLSASSEELAATTTQQSAAVTEASATTEELARASASIADTVDAVAAQAAETRDNLEQAEADIQASSARTVALAERVNEIGAILTLINEIADQTNLLALNAAIEAAWAGEGGRGFAVVAEEVRRLAERSKSSAAEIAGITEGVHSETNATVMAMEKGAKQMQRGLALLEDVAQSTEQVRLTTQQQRSATTQVVETMDQLTAASRQVSATAQELASASSSLAGLAGNLEQTAAAAKDRY